MGKLLILKNYIFLVYGSDILEKRKHIHVTFAYRGFKQSCKFWLEPEIRIDPRKQGNFTDQEVNEIEKLIREHREILMKQLDLFYNHQPVKAIRL
jgi:hypothetical protein